MADIPDEHISVCTDIIEYAKEHLTQELNENIYITLTDHISFAHNRQKSNMNFKNHLLWEIKNFYPTEFSIGEHAIEIIYNRLGVSLSEDDDVQFQQIVKQRYFKDYRCAELIYEYVLDKFQHKISDEEMMYLTVHLRRITRG